MSTSDKLIKITHLTLHFGIKICNRIEKSSGLRKLPVVANAPFDFRQFFGCVESHHIVIAWHASGGDMIGFGVMVAGKIVHGIGQVQFALSVVGLKTFGGFVQSRSLKDINGYINLAALRFHFFRRELERIGKNER